MRGAIPIHVRSISTISNKLTNNTIKELNFKVNFSGPVKLDLGEDPEELSNEYRIRLKDTAYTVYKIDGGAETEVSDLVTEKINENALKRFTTIAPQYYITADITTELTNHLLEIGSNHDIISLVYSIEGSNNKYRLYPKVSYTKGMAFYTIERQAQITNAPNHLNIFLNTTNTPGSIGVYCSYINSSITESPNIPDAMLTGKEINFTLKYI
jgi:hypothetical protein